jgi:putative MATE family efflux protein
VIALAVPVVLGQLMQFSMSVINLFWVGRLGPSAQDAITTAMVIIWTVYASASIFTVGATALISRSVGAGDTRSAMNVLRQAFLFGNALSIVYAIAGFVLAPHLVEFMGSSPETTQHAVPYIRVFFASVIFFSVTETAYAAFRASGNTRTPTWVGMLVVGINAALDPVLIFGFGPIPALGVMGAAVASAVGMMVGAVIIMRESLRGKLGYEYARPFVVTPNWEILGKIAKIGLPMATQQIGFVAVYWFLMSIVHRFGDSAGAAMGIGNRMESLSYLTCWGFSIAASTMVGQNLGAGKQDRARKGAWTSVGLAVAATAISSALFILLPHQIANIFSNDEAVRAIAVDYLIILGVSQTTMAIEIVLEGAFSGAGDTLPPMLVFLPGSIARIPLAYYLAISLGWGINGVWWTLTITTLAKAAVLAFWFSRNRWAVKAL